MCIFKSLQKPLMALFLLCLFPLGAMAQSVVKGTVNDEAGDPVIGATVKVQGIQSRSHHRLLRRFPGSGWQQCHTGCLLCGL